MDIDDRNVLVTGAARGIGAATAILLAERGAARVVLADIESLEETAKAVAAAGAEPIMLTADLSRPEAVVGLLQKAESETGGLDIVLNNAGIMAGGREFPDTAVDDMVRVIQINLIAMMVGTHEAIRLMRGRGGGVIVNTGSVAAFGPMPADPAYSASKAGIVNFTQSCKPLHESLGIRVMTVCPGIVDTAIVPRDAAWLQPALASLKALAPRDIAEVVVSIIEDDTQAGEFVTVENEPL
jgi:3-oxoacyl-[acyl-carrier protein] reductase